MSTHISLELFLGQKHSFTFDKVFAPDASQEEVFVEISQLVQSALDGYKVTSLFFCPFNKSFQNVLVVQKQTFAHLIVESTILNFFIFMPNSVMNSIFALLSLGFSLVFELSVL